LIAIVQISCGGVEQKAKQPPALPTETESVKDPELGLPLCSAGLPVAAVQPGNQDLERVEFDIIKDGVELPAISFVPRGMSGVPVVLMLSGGSIDGTRYDWLGDFLASNGYATVIAQRNGGGDRLELPSAMLAALVETELNERIDAQRIVIAGHSFGGLNALCLASPNGCPWPVDPKHIPPGLIAVITLMAHAQPFDEPDMNTPMQVERVPVMMIQGTRDGRASVEEVTATFNRLEGNTGRFLVTLSGVNHYQMAECLDLKKDNYRGELAAEVTHPVALERAARAMLAFLNWVDGGPKVVDKLNDSEGIMVEER